MRFPCRADGKQRPRQRPEGTGGRDGDTGTRGHGVQTGVVDSCRVEKRRPAAAKGGSRYWASPEANYGRSAGHGQTGGATPCHCTLHPCRPSVCSLHRGPYGVLYIRPCPSWSPFPDIRTAVPPLRPSLACHPTETTGRPSSPSTRRQPWSCLLWTFRPSLLAHNRCGLMTAAGASALPHQRRKRPHLDLRRPPTPLRFFAPERPGNFETALSSHR